MPHFFTLECPRAENHDIFGQQNRTAHCAFFEFQSFRLKTLSDTHKHKHALIHAIDRWRWSRGMFDTHSTIYIYTAFELRSITLCVWTIVYSVNYVKVVIVVSSSFSSICWFPAPAIFSFVLRRDSAYKWYTQLTDWPFCLSYIDTPLNSRLFLFIVRRAFPF